MQIIMREEGPPHLLSLKKTAKFGGFFRYGRFKCDIIFFAIGMQIIEIARHPIHACFALSDYASVGWDYVLPFEAQAAVVVTVSGLGLRS